MSYIPMPVQSDLPSYEFQITLESVVYTLNFYYNARSDRWTMSIMDESGNYIVMGIVLVAGVLLTSRFIDFAIPPGDFFLFDTENSGTDPGRDDLGGKFQLIYRESTTSD